LADFNASVEELTSSSRKIKFQVQAVLQVGIINLLAPYTGIWAASLLSLQLRSYSDHSYSRSQWAIDSTFIPRPEECTTECEIILSGQGKGYGGQSFAKPFRKEPAVLCMLWCRKLVSSPGPESTHIAKLKKKESLVNGKPCLVKYFLQCCSRYFPSEWGLLKMTHHHIN